MKNTKNIIIGILILIILVGGIWFGNSYYLKPKYQTQGAEIGAANIINTINQNGQVPVVNNNTVQWIDINTICGGAG